MKDSLFHNTAVRLTLWYLAIIMVLSISLSMVLYHVSAGELRQSIQAQISYYSEVLSPTDLREFTEFRLNQLSDDLTKLKERLLLINLIIFLGGGAASYILARKTMRPLEHSMESQSRFTGDASHELRTPLTVMQSEIEVALRNPKLTKAQAVELLQSNLEETAKLKSLSDGLLALASDDSRLELNEKVSTKAVVLAAKKRVSKMAETKKMNIKIMGDNQEVRGSEQYLTDTIVILLDNAIKFSPVGSEITILTEKRDRWLRISVIDKGLGIEPEELPRIFERFYRTDSARGKSDTGGYGLGLAIAKKMAKLHHGSIQVRSAPGMGSTFTLRIPA